MAEQLETITRPRLDKETFITKMIALAHQRGNTLQSSLIKEYADARCEGGYSDDLLRQIRIACMKNGCFIDDDLRLNESYHADVRHYTNKLIGLMDSMSIDAKWLATSLMNYISEDSVADFAHYNDYFDVDEIESQYDVRQATNHFIELFDEGVLDPKDVVKNLLLYMSEDTVANFCHDYELSDDEEEELNESLEEVIPADAVEKVLLSLDSEISDSNIVSAQAVSDLVEDYLVQNDLSLDLKDDLEEKVVEKLVDSDILVTDEEVVKCSWCEEEYPESDCKKEKDLGWLCDHCQRALESRGEKLEFEESDSEWENKQWEVDGFTYDSEEEARNAFNQAVDTEPSSDHVLMYGDEEIKFHNGL